MRVSAEGDVFRVPPRERWVRGVVLLGLGQKIKYMHALKWGQGERNGVIAAILPRMGQVRGSLYLFVGGVKKKGKVEGQKQVTDLHIPFYSSLSLTFSSRKLHPGF